MTNHPKRPCQWVIKTESGHLWLIERARSEQDALDQYYRGDAEPHTSVQRGCDRSMNGRGKRRQEMARKLKAGVKYGLIQMCNTAARAADYWYKEAQKDILAGELGRAAIAQSYARSVADEAIRYRIKILSHHGARHRAVVLGRRD